MWFEPILSWDFATCRNIQNMLAKTVLLLNCYLCWGHFWGRPLPPAALNCGQFEAGPNKLRSNLVLVPNKVVVLCMSCSPSILLVVHPHCQGLLQPTQRANFDVDSTSNRSRKSAEKRKNISTVIDKASKFHRSTSIQRRIDVYISFFYSASKRLWTIDVEIFSVPTAKGLQLISRNIYQLELLRPYDC